MIGVAGTFPFVVLRRHETHGMPHSLRVLLGVPEDVGVDVATFTQHFEPAVAGIPGAPEKFLRGVVTLVIRCDDAESLDQQRQREPLHQHRHDDHREGDEDQALAFRKPDR